VGRNDADQELVQRCIAREPGAWRQFADRFLRTVRALGRRYLKLHGYLPDEGELDDIVQEVFLALNRRDYKLLRNYDPTYTFKTYLGAITRTEVHRVLRKKRPSTAAPEDLEAASAADEDTALEIEREEQKEVLLRALEKLPDRDREILKLRFFRELDYKTIAERLQIPEASVGQTLFRAKQKLLKALRGILGILV